ncbi:MAG: hypothetical protein HY953_01080, partial [Candidatus Rokubacteria bacterium]|nr:hypothetical protein [Candidatus Rokubacteria bacterium]
MSAFMLKTMMDFRSLLLASLLGLPALPLAAGDKELWVEVKSPHFVALSDAGESEARTALGRFEEIRNVFRGVFPNLRVDSGRPLTLLVLRDQASMRRFLPRQFEGKDPALPGGWFSQTEDQDYAVLRLDVPRTSEHPYFVLYHEYTHGIIHANFANTPVWLDEGIADFYGATEILKDKVLIGRPPESHVRRLQESALLPPDIFFAVDHQSPHYRDGGKRGLFYSQSWAAVHYLFSEPEALKSDLLRKLMQAQGASADPLAAPQAAFGDPKAFLGKVNAYIRRGAFRYLTYGLSARLSDRDFTAKQLGRAEALVVRAEFLSRAQPSQAALPLLQEALALDPGLARAHAALGFHHYREG